LGDKPGERHGIETLGVRSRRKMPGSSAPLSVKDAVFATPVSYYRFNTD
jgi:hypothetical protein